jgi:AraC family ethanolamine operon transcriptional activator
MGFAFQVAIEFSGTTGMTNDFFVVDGSFAQPMRGDSTRVQICVAHDADEQARNLRGWSQTYDQLTAGAFVGTLTELSLDQMHVFCETTSHTLRQSCEVPSDAYWFGIPVRRDVPGRIDANVIDNGAIVFRPGGIEFELITPAAYEIFGVVVKGELLRRYAAEVEHPGVISRLPDTEVVPVDETHKAHLCASLRQILDDGANGTSPLTGVARDSLQSSVLASLLDLWAQPHAEGGAIPTKPRRHQIVSKAREYVLANRERPVGVPELCEKLHVSRRTLQYCFQDALGMAPATYLRTIRLNGARRELCEAARSVQDVAAAWGFWHLSQFATDYRKLFGKRPSETLKESMPNRRTPSRLDSDLRMKH